MTTAMVVYILIVTVPLIGTTMLVERLCQLWTLPARGAWLAAGLAIVLIGGRTVVQQIVPQRTSTLMAISNVKVIHRVSPGTIDNIRRVAGEVTSFPRSAAAYAAHATGAVQNRILATLWGGASILMLTFVCFMYLRVWYATRHWKVTDFVGEKVRVAPCTGPAVVGLFRPEIVVPYWMLESSAEDGWLVVMHETEHRNARDPLLLAVMWTLVALVPWHPGAWYCLARARLAIELDCDARVVRRGASLRTYAELLLNQARVRLRAPVHFWLGATSLLEPSSHLERRLTAMILPNDPSTSPRPVVRYLRTLSYVAVVSTIAIAACESHVPTAADISGLDAASAEANARKVSIVADKPVTFYVDNVHVSADSARAISARNISGIRVTKRSQLAGGDAIWITVADSQHNVRPMAQSSDTGAEHSGLVVRKKQPFTGLVMIDDVASDVTAMNSIDPSTIATVEVIKGPAAIEKYSDPRAIEGVIVVTLKH